MMSFDMGGKALRYCLEFRDILACLYYRDNENILLLSSIH